MKGKIAVVTGGTRGIGKQTARGLAQRGATVAVVGRSQARGDEALEQLRAAASGQDPLFLQADLASLAETRQLAETVADLGRLDVLVNNAAVVSATRRESADGHEQTLAVDHLAPFLLTELLIPTLRSTPGSRVVNVTSGVIRQGDLELDDLQSTSGYKPLDAYRRAKLMNLVWTYDLARRLEGSGVSVFAVDPGVADTGTHRDYPWPAPVRLGLTVARKLFPGRFSAANAAASSIRAASAPDLHADSGRMLDRRGEPVEPPALVRDHDLAQTVDRISRDLVSGSDQ